MSLKKKVKEIKDYLFFKGKKSYLRQGVELVLVLIAVFGIRAFIFQPFKIPSESMYPTLIIGDYMVVSTGAYGHSRHALPYSLPLFSGRLLYKQPQRGDIVVFRHPAGAEMSRWQRFSEDVLGFFRSNSYIPADSYWIKRVVGLPGDKIQVKKGILYINGKVVPQKRIEDFEEKMASGRSRFVPQLIEILPNGVAHKILREDLDGEQRGDNTPEYDVPADHLFLMGDNRNHSADSRSDLGPVHKDYLIAQPKYILFSLDSSIFDLVRVWDWGTVIRGSRFFKDPMAVAE